MIPRPDLRKVSAPHKLTNPPPAQAAKNTPGDPAAVATSPGVRKIPTPITKLTTIIVRSNAPNLG